MSRARMERLRLPARWVRWLLAAAHEEETELAEAIRPRPGTWRDAVAALAALIVVVGGTRRRPPGNGSTSVPSPSPGPVRCC